MRCTKIGCLQILCLILLVRASEHNEPTKQLNKRGVAENLGQGLKFAGQMFGINTAADVANLVAMAFGNKKPDLMSLFQQKQTNAAEADSESDASQQDTGSQEQQPSNVKHRHRYKQQQQQQQQQETDESDEQSREPLSNSEFSTSRFVTGVLRMIGFDATKLGALAINALIMIAQAIGNAFTAPTRTSAGYTPSPTTPYDDGDEGVPEAQRNGEQEAHQPRALREGTPIDWYLENPNEGMRRTLNDALDTQLTERITEMIENVEQQEGQQAGCIKLLMCKSSPIIWGMQRSVSERVTGKATTDNTVEDNAEGKKKAKPKKLFSTDVFFAHFPTLEEFREHGAICEERFGKQCNVDENDDTAETKEKKPK
ncbi:PREDICTED: uncharacterized protein LOC108382110 [Rhagoletis zephyria]|uniref:uncharacterized protein LOC108382110 n=1 Tax=Rhagoletis zephyria TaxID=28612 RepID=UPI0008115FBD|nr:PREDICTED: uncharacterized protein LOC108382110 [Rhagoletis zephyria]